jgi:excisionase family DNA binding protein
MDQSYWGKESGVTMTHTPDVVKADIAGIVPLLTAEQVAQIFQVHPMTPYSWAAAGKLPCVKLGKTLRFRWQDIERIINGQD